MNVLLMFEFVEEHEQWIYSQLFLIYQITPDSFTIDKRPKFTMMSYIFWETKNLSQSHRHGMVDIILDYMDSTKTIERKFINVPEGDGGKRRRSENQINRVYYVIALVRNRGHLFKRSRFGATKSKKNKSFFSSSLFSFLRCSPYPSPFNEVTIQRLSYWFSVSFARP